MCEGFWVISITLSADYSSYWTF